MLSISVSLVAVFIPILLMGGIVGRLFREFAVTLSVAIGVSMVVSLTTTPMMCATLLKPARRGAARPAVPRQRVGLQLDSRRLREDARLGAAASVHHAAGHAGARSVFTVYLYVIVPKGFFPQQDTGRSDRQHPGRPGHLVPGDGALC